MSAIVMAGVAAGATVVGGWPFALLWLAAAIAIAAEWLAMTKAEPRALLTGVLAAGLIGLAIVLMAGASAEVGLAIAALTMTAIAVLAVDGRARLWALLGAVYAGVTLVAPVTIREDGAFGLAAIAWIFAVVWTTDVAAYFVGRAVGGPKLYPRVSPKKTWSGLLGGLAAGTAAGIAVSSYADSLGWTLPAGAVVLAAAAATASVASQIGDLAESALKRHFQVKDSGRLLPGHGGVMDRLDGFVAVVLLVGLARLVRL
jgi:phosphatidate cytidylyltransferase